MPPMEREKHEELLTKLLNPEISQSDKTEILSELRGDYNAVHTDFSDLAKSNEKFEKTNLDLLQSNSMLFRQAGMLNRDEPPEEEKKQEFSETVTLEQLEARR